MSCPHCHHCQLLRWAPPKGAFLQSQLMERYRMGYSTMAKAASVGLIVAVDVKGDPEPRRRWYLVPDEKALREWYSATPYGRPTMVRDKENRQLAGLCWLMLFGAELSGAAILRMADKLGASKTALERAIKRAREIDVSLTEAHRIMGRSGVVHDPLALAPGMRIAVARSENGRTRPLMFETLRRDVDAWVMVEGGRVADDAPCWARGWVTFTR